MKNLLKSAPVLLIQLITMGCVITYMDKPYPKNSELFNKEGEGIKDTEKHLVKCSHEADERYPRSNISQGLNYVHYCMLRDGYEFKNSPKGRPYCVRGSFTWEEIACLYYRGEIVRNRSGEITWNDGTKIKPDDFMITTPPFEP